MRIRLHYVDPEGRKGYLENPKWDTVAKAIAYVKKAGWAANFRLVRAERREN